jgi:hypothetical protein
MAKRSCDKVVRAKNYAEADNSLPVWKSRRCHSDARWLVSIVYSQAAHNYNYSTADYFDFAFCTIHRKTVERAYANSDTWVIEVHPIEEPEQQRLFNATGPHGT